MLDGVRTAPKANGMERDGLGFWFELPTPLRRVLDRLDRFKPERVALECLTKLGMDLPFNQQVCVSVANNRSEVGIIRTGSHPGRHRPGLYVCAGGLNQIR